MSKNQLLFAGFTLLCVPLCHAADSPWTGTWKLNEAKSQRTGGVDTIQKSVDGKYTVATSGLILNFRCDSADYPLPGGRVLTCSQGTADAMHVVIKAGGEELVQMERKLSDRGKTMTVEETGKSADGTPFRETEIYKKTVPGSGDAWTGTWQNTRVDASSQGVAIVERSGDSITFTYPMRKSKLTARLDGTPAVEQAPHAEEGLLISLRAADPRTIQEIDTLNGKVVEHDTLRVSGDGRTMTVESQRTGDNVRQVYVYDKQ